MRTRSPTAAPRARAPWRLAFVIAVALPLGALPLAPAPAREAPADRGDGAVVRSLDTIGARARALAAEGRLAESESLIRIVLNRKTAVLPPADAGLLADFMFLAHLLQNRGQAAEAIATLTRVTRQADQGTRAGRLQLAAAHRELGLMQARRGHDYSARLNLMKALAWYRLENGARSLDAADMQFEIARLETRALQLDRAKARLEDARAAVAAAGGDPRRLARIEQTLGEWHFRQALFRDAAGHYRKAVALRQSALGPRHLETAQSIVSLASAMKSMGRFSAAEELYRGGLAVYEERLGPDHAYIATLLNNLGQLYYNQGRYDEAEEALDRAVEIVTEAEGADHIALAPTFNHLGYMYYRTGRYRDALANLEPALAMWTRPATARPRYAANARLWIGAVKRETGDLAGAAADLDTAVADLQRIYGAGSPATGEALFERGLLHLARGEAAAAEADLTAAAGVWDAIGQPEHIGAIRARAALARLLADRGDLDPALAAARRATGALAARINRDSGERARSLASEMRVLREAVVVHVDLLFLRAEAAVRDGADPAPWIAESFRVGQVARATSAAQALARVSARFAAGDSPLAALVRERQDLSERWRELDERLSIAILQSAEWRDAAREKRMRAESEALRKSIHGLDGRLAAEFPGYTELSVVKPQPLAAVQAALAGDEAMVVLLVGRDRTFVWAVSRGAARLHRIDQGSAAMAGRVRALRRALEPDSALQGDGLRPFPAAAAHELYRDLVGPAEDLVAGARHLIVVPDGALQSLPPAVLVTAPPAAEPRTAADHAGIAWLGLRQATSLLPSVSSLAVLRTPRPGAAPARPFVGFGDPRLKRRVRQAAKASRPAESVTPGLFAPGGEAWREALSQFGELPDTAGELRRVAGLLGAPEDAVFLRDRATEGTLRAQDLAAFRVIQFATHGLMAGEFQGLLEPALVMTPPLHLIPGDDGLLTASEITQLKLNAEWVILSACNTAADDGTPGAEGLSGLAKAFFFAGGRTLLVSHWEVASATAVALTTGLFEALARSPGLGRAEAFRRAMAAVVADPADPRQAHPLFWAPFTVVGEGGAGDTRRARISH